MKYPEFQRLKSIVFKLLIALKHEFELLKWVVRLNKGKGLIPSEFAKGKTMLEIAKND